ncbi:MAG: NUDIX domain-containing protein [Bacteroidota bacterium]|jgi:8-oxo-dGTP diphosphatase
MSLPFNVRVYGILIDGNRLLVSDEKHLDMAFTKLPGGGLQFGEGTVDCLKREFREEIGLEIEIVSHFYTVDFFQPSAFNAQQQVISIYYVVKPRQILQQDPTLNEQNEHGLRWLALHELSAETFSLPIDRHITPMILERFMGSE